MKQIEYSEYNDIKEIIERGNVESSYEDLMKKENHVLDTVNQVIKYYRDKDIYDGEFIHNNLVAIASRLGSTWKDIIEEIVLVKSVNDIYYMFTKEDRPIYIGLTFIVIALILFLLDSSGKW
jgi:hypothetical protein